MIQMPEYGSLEKFYRCIKEHMKGYRGSNDVEKIYEAHCIAVKKCSKEILEREKGG